MNSALKIVWKTCRHYYTGDGDGPLSNFLAMNRANNWRGFRNRLTDMGWRFFPHDCEHTLLATSWVSGRATNSTTTGSNRSDFTYSNSEWLHEDLATNAEYKLKIADVAQKFLFNGGALTPAATQALFDARAMQINQAIIADCVRWGTSATNHTYAQWQARLDNIRTNFFPARHTAVLAQLQSRGFYPAVSPPVFGQRGGQVATGYQLTLSAGAQTGTIYYTTNGSDPRASGGAAVGTAYADAIPLSGLTTVRTRFRSSGGVWSALDEATFTTLAPAMAGKLVVSRLQYHPTDPTAAEVAAGFNSEADFEYIELQNISNETLDLRGVNFTNGVSFNFASAAIQTLAPGSVVLIAGNAAGLAARHGTGLPVAGTFGGDLSNGGEFIQFVDANGDPVVKFTYDDVAPWPVQADGGGFALVLKNPEANPDPNLGSNWRASYAPGGNPGQVDQISIAAWRTLYFSEADLADPAKETTLWGSSADPDRDGSTNLAEFALGSSPIDQLSRPSPALSRWTDTATSLEYLRMTCIVREGMARMLVTAQASGDLKTWQDALPQIGQPVSQGNGTAIFVFQDTVPISEAPNQRRYLRMSAQSY